MTIFSSIGRPIDVAGGFDTVRAQHGDVSYWLEDKLHRLDGPALETRDGEKHWYRNGLRHRLGAPALVKADGTELFFVDGIPVEMAAV